MALRRTLKLPLGEAGSSEGVVHDLSLTGLLLETSHHLTVGQRIEFDLPERGPTAAIVVWNSGKYFGCEFDARITQGAVSAAVLRSPTVGKAEVDSETVHSPAEEAYAKLSPPVRALTLVGLTAASWGLIFLLARWAIHAIA
ncbi:MAG TPA: PilZ domain-containing protein [Sphingomicrobium sp.]|nr:PilZ domain-containing protein [Sphingomicrobium sp.]